jgi:hypothetical protein
VAPIRQIWVPQERHIAVVRLRNPTDEATVFEPIPPPARGRQKLLAPAETPGQRHGPALLPGSAPTEAKRAWRRPLAARSTFKSRPRCGVFEPARR